MSPGMPTLRPVLSGPALIREIADARPADGSLFTFNTADVGEFAAFMAAGLPEQSVTVLQCAGRWTVGGPAGR
jgi:hypothetical protein